MSEYRYEDFWPKVGDAYAASDPLGAVCWDGSPAWFNRFFAHFQVRAVERAMRSQFGDGQRSGRALDLGCGTGRWTRWLDRWWSEPIGVDLSRGMLGAADRRHPYLQTDIARLPFADATFDMALSVTVLLHLPYDVQERAVREVARCLKPDARFVLMEMVNRVAPSSHVFPRTIGGWSALLDAAGFDVLHVAPEAHAPLLRAGFACARRFGIGAVRGDALGEAKRGELGGGPTAASIAGLRGPALLAARAAVALSYPLEYAAGPLLPRDWALNVCIVARKRPDS